MKLDHTLAGDVEEACYRNLKSGSRFLLWYTDDDVWHEAMIGVIVGKEHAVIHTPDGDSYVERLSCLGAEGPAKLRGLTSTLTLPRNLRAPAYRFKGRMTNEYIKQVFRDALKAAEEEGYSPDTPSEIVDKDGNVTNLDAFFGGSFVWRRRTLGNPGALAEDDKINEKSPKNARIVRAAVGDSVWVAAEPIAGLVLGQEVSLNEETDVQVGDRVALAFRKGEYVKVEMIRVTEASNYADRRRALFVDSRASGSGECPAAAPKSPDAGEKGDGPQDSEVRTLWVDFDEHGERFKRWRDVVKECYTPVFEDKPLEGPATALHVIKHSERHGGDPRLWLQMWLRTKHIETTDRTYHELKVLGDALFYAGTFDQLNIPALISMEVLCRRIQAIVDAYSHPNRPSWENAKIFAGQGSPEDIVSPTFRSYAAKRNKDELELLQARQKVRELRGSPAIPFEEGDPNDALPPKPTPKPKKKGGGKGGQGQGDA